MVIEPVHTQVLHRLVVLPDGVQHGLRVELGPKDDQIEFLSVDALDDLGCIEQVVVLEIEELGWIRDHWFVGQQAEHGLFAENGTIGGTDIVEDFLARCIVIGGE